MTLIIGFLIPLLGTMLGAAFVFFMKDDLSPRVQKTLLGFASGVMVATSVWSLLIPAMETVADSGKWSVLPAAAGFLLGIFFLLALDELTPHLTHQKVPDHDCRAPLCWHWLSLFTTYQKAWPSASCLQELSRVPQDCPLLRQ